MSIKPLQKFHYLLVSRTSKIHLWHPFPRTVSFLFTIYSSLSIVSTSLTWIITSSRLLRLISTACHPDFLRSLLECCDKIQITDDAIMKGEVGRAYWERKRRKKDMLQLRVFYIVVGQRGSAREARLSEGLKNLWHFMLVLHSVPAIPIVV